jgi:hypothetical protein
MKTMIKVIIIKYLYVYSWWNKEIDNKLEEGVYITNYNIKERGIK